MRWKNGGVILVKNLSIMACWCFSAFLGDDMTGYATTLRAKARFQETTIAWLQVIGAALWMSLCAQIEIPLGWTPVPLTFQTIGVLTVGLFLSPRRAALAVLCYLGEGCLGLPVWAGGGAGFAHLYGITGGYLMSYPLQAYLIAWCIRQDVSHSRLYVWSVLVSSIVLQLSLGTVWLAQFVGWSSCWTYGFCPFLLGDITKASLVMLLWHRYRNI